MEDCDKIEDQANNHNSTTTSRPLKLPLHITITKPLAPSLLSPFSPSTAELVGHDLMRSQMVVALVARGPEFEHRALRVMEMTIHLTQIVRMSTMAVADEEKESDESTAVVKDREEEGEKKRKGINSEDVAEHHRSMMFKRGLKTLNKEYSHNSNCIVDGWMERYFQLGGDAGAVTAPGPRKQSTPTQLNNPDSFETPRQAANALMSPSTVLPDTVRRVRGIN